MNKEFIDLIDKIKTISGKDQKTIASELKYSETYLSQLMTNAKKASSKIYERVKLFYARYLLGSVGFEDIKPTDVTYSNEDLRRFTLAAKKMENNLPFIKGQIPFISRSIQKKYATESSKNDFIDSLPDFGLPPNVSSTTGTSWMYWEMDGDSMEDTIYEGDVLLTNMVTQMDWEDNLKDQHVYVLVLKDEILIQRVAYKNSNQLVLISDNYKKHPQRLIDLKDIEEIWMHRFTWTKKINPPKKFEIEV